MSGVSVEVLHGSIGAFLIGCFFSLAMLGLNWSQVYYYYREFRADSKKYKWIVGIGAALDTGHTVLACTLVYSALVVHYADAAYLLKSPWSFSVDPAVTGSIGFLVQSFYAYRIYCISGRKHLLLPFIVLALSFIQLGFAAASSYYAFTLVYFSSFHLPGNPTWVVYTWLGSAVAADIIITASIIYYLRESKKRSTEETDDLLQKIVFIVLENNLLTGVMAIIHAVLFATLSTTYHVIANYILVKLYFSSLLVSLNSRAGLRKKLAHDRLMLPMGTVTQSSFSGLSHSNDEKRLAGMGNVVTRRSTVTDRLERRDYEEYFNDIDGKKNQYYADTPVIRPFASPRQDSDATLSPAFSPSTLGPGSPPAFSPTFSARAGTPSFQLNPAFS